MNHFFSTSLLFCSAILFSVPLQAHAFQFRHAECLTFHEEGLEELAQSGDDPSEDIALEIEPEDRPVAGMYANSETTHKGAFHKVVSIVPEINTVELEDGSKWSVQPEDFENTLNWAPKDVIVIAPNHWNYTYDFRLTNQNKETSVAANLSLMPIYNGVHTHWILGIDHNNRIILLEDGSVWKTSMFSDSIIKNWNLNEIVIIGINDSWFRGKKRNILINVDALDYASCNCINVKSLE